MQNQDPGYSPDPNVKESQKTKNIGDKMIDKFANTFTMFNKKKGQQKESESEDKYF